MEQTQELNEWFKKINAATDKQKSRRGTGTYQIKITYEKNYLNTNINKKVFHMEQKNISISLLQPNRGQIIGLPKNPRIIKDQKFKDLVKSIQDDPEMLALRECIIFPFADIDQTYSPKWKEAYIIIAGEMRYTACKHLGYEEIPCKILDSGTPIEKLKAIMLKDNVNYGEWEMDELSKWDLDTLEDYGLDMPDIETDLEGNKIREEELRPFTRTHVLISFSPDTLIEIQEQLEQIKKTPGVEYETSSNG